MVELLLENGADANVRYSNSGKTPLFVAVEKGNERLVNLLLTHYADVDFSTANGKLPLQKAREMGNFEISKWNYHEKNPSHDLFISGNNKIVEILAQKRQKKH